MQMEGWARPLPAGRARSRCLEQTPLPVGSANFPAGGPGSWADGGVWPEGGTMPRPPWAPHSAWHREGRAGWNALRSRAHGHRLWALLKARGPGLRGELFALLPEADHVHLARLPRCFRLAFLFDLRLKYFSWWQKWLRAFSPSQGRRNVPENSGVPAPSLPEQAACDPWMRKAGRRPAVLAAWAR